MLKHISYYFLFFINCFNTQSIPVLSYTYVIILYQTRSVHFESLTKNYHLIKVNRFITSTNKIIEIDNMKFIFIYYQGLNL